MKLCFRRTISHLDVYWAVLMSAPTTWQVVDKAKILSEVDWLIAPYFSGIGVVRHLRQKSRTTDSTRYS
jgi:hypothetical protein